MNEKQMAILVAHAVNSMANSLDAEHRCCPHGCAPCAVLLELVTDGSINTVVRPYVDQTGDDWDWWDPHAGLFRVGWLVERWCTPATCEFREEEEEVTRMEDK